MQTILRKALCCSAACFVALVANGVSADTPLRIVAFNAEILAAPGVRASELQRYRFDFARTQHIERVADVVETLDPDVLNLAEVISRESVDQLVAILHEKGLTDFKGYHVESNDSFTGMDVALISKIEPDEIDGQVIRTINSESDDPTWRQAFSFKGYDGSLTSRTTSLSRNSLYFLTVAGHKLGFFGLHLKSNPSDAYANAKRTAQADVVVRAIRSEILNRGYTPLILGDLNDYDPDVPDRDETRATKTRVLRTIKDYNPDSDGPELVNAAEWMPRQADRYTSHWDWNENGARDPQDVFTMIDHILIPKQLEPYVQRAFVCRNVALETSDHYPVVVDLLLPPAP